MSTTTASTPALTRAITLSITSPVTPTAAPHRSLPPSSVALLGYLIAFSISFIVISPLRWPVSSTMGSFSTFHFLRIFSASFMDVPSLAVINLSFVITSLIITSGSLSNLTSLFVRIPTRILFLSVMGTPEMWYLLISSNASSSLCSGERKKGSVITPCSLLFTLSTSIACASIDMFLWIIPIPPSLAIDIAILASVTVSIPALITGMFSFIFFVNCVFKSTCPGRISDFCGTNRTSSNVSPSFKNFPSISTILSIILGIRKNPE